MILWNKMTDTQQTLTKSILKNAMRQGVGLSEESSEKVYTSIIEALKNMFHENDILKIVDFGTFAIRHKEPRIGRNPKTKEEVLIQSRRSVRFRPSKHLRAITNKEQENLDPKK